MKAHILKGSAIILVSMLMLSGCSSVRSEFYRGETYYKYNLGNLSYKAGEYDEAEGYFTEVVALDPAYARAYAGLGNVLLMKGDFKKAEESYRKAMAINPDLLEKLLPSLLSAMHKKKEKMVRDWGIDLNKVHELLASGKVKELEEKIAKDVPVDLLAAERTSISAKELLNLDGLIIRLVDNREGSPKLRFFKGCYMHNRGINRTMAAEVMVEAAEGLGRNEKQKAYIIAGNIYRRLGRVNMAVRAYEKALDAGAEIEQVAASLSAIYGVSVEEIIEAEKLSSQVTIYDDSYKSHTDTNTYGTAETSVLKPVKIHGSLSNEKIKTTTEKN